MRIAALSDIHGNLLALEAVLEDVGRRGVDLTVNLGDILSGALLPGETAQRLMALALPTISGNHERQVLCRLRGAHGGFRSPCPRGCGPQRAWIAALPPMLRPWRACSCATQRRTTMSIAISRIWWRGSCGRPPVRSIEERSLGCDASLILCGHSHIPQGDPSWHRPTRGESGERRPPGVRRQRSRTASGGNRIAACPLCHPRKHPRGWKAELAAVPYDWDEAAKLAPHNGREDWARALATGFVRAA